MVKAHSPINWQNEPSTNTPINETNLNKMDSTIGVLDDRIIEQETSKLDKSTAYTMVKDISFNENNGVFTITLLNGSTKTLDTKLEKISINFSYNAETQQIEIILIDGTKQYIDISSLISPIDFVDSDTIGWEVTSDWKVKAKVLDGSITEDMLQPNYLAEIKVETEKSAQSMANAKISENNAKQSELNAKESEEQALEYSNNAQPLAQSVSGNNPTATNSANGNIIYLNNKGYQQQQELAFDGKFTTTSNGIKTTNLIPCKNGDVLTIQCESGVKNILLYDANGDELRLIAYIMPMPTHREVTIDKDTSGGVYVELDITDTNVTILVNGSLYATPSPDYPIHIGANGDKGYFDGVLRQGGHNASGEFQTLTDRVSCKNPICCKPNDVICVNSSGLTGVHVTYFKENVFVTRQVLDNESGVYEFTAPSNVDSFYFNAINSNGITPSTAKHICVTINGMYAVRVKTVGKNELKTNVATTTHNGVTFTFNEDDKSVTVNGTADSSFSFTIGKANVDNTKTYILNGCPRGGGWGKFALYTDINSNVYDYGSGANYTPETTKETSFFIYVWSGVTVSNLTFKPMLRRADITDDTYEPHQETEALIPVSAPFYKGDYIEVYADGSGREYRVNNSTVIDGSQNIYSVSDGKNGGKVIGIQYDSCMPDVIRSVRSVSDKICDKLSPPTTTTPTSFTECEIGHWGFNTGDGETGNTFFIFCVDADISTVEDAQTWLSNNPIHVVYKRKEPTSTPLTAEQVAEFLKLRTYKGVTHVTADGEVVMRYYCDTDSGETVSMLQGMVEEHKHSLFTTVSGETNAQVKPQNESSMTELYASFEVPEGYQIIGLNGWYSSNFGDSDIKVLGIKISGTKTLSIKLRNTSDVNKNVSIEMTVLCAKTDTF